MGKMFYLVSAYILLWAVLFVYLFNLIKKQRFLTKEVENLKKILSEKQK